MMLTKAQKKRHWKAEADERQGGVAELMRQTEVQRVRVMMQTKAEEEDEECVEKKRLQQPHSACAEATQAL
jgi:hypothetical protein